MYTDHEEGSMVTVKRTRVGYEVRSERRILAVFTHHGPTPEAHALDYLNSLKPKPKPKRKSTAKGKR